MTKDIYGMGFAWICPFCEEVIGAKDEEELAARKQAHLPCSKRKKVGTTLDYFIKGDNDE